MQKHIRQLHKHVRHHIEHQTFVKRHEAIVLFVLLVILFLAFLSHRSGG